jgi:uncharacterized protein
MTTQIVLKKGKEVPKNAIVIEGFPSKGFVSTIAARYMIDELGMEDIGFIESDRVRSVAVIHNAVPMRPIRIYAKGNIVVFLSEIIIPIQHGAEFSNALTAWIGKIAPNRVVLLAGITGKGTEKDHEIFGIANTDELNWKLEELKIKKVEEGMLTGISSDLLLYCVENQIPSISLMTETKNLPDPLAAASMLAILSKLIDLKIDTKRLIEEGKKIEEMFKEIMEQTKRGKEGHKEMEDYSPMYQ